MFGSPGMNLMAAGVASAICILIFSNILKGKSGSQKEKKETPVEENRCSCCLRPFLLGRGVRCSDCGGRSCRKGCSRWDTSDNAWHCLFCHQQRHWLRKNGLEDYRGSIVAVLRRHFSTAKSQLYAAGVENAATSSGSCLPGEKEEANTMETIRDLVEKIVEGLIGSVEDIPIDRLYDHPEYDKLLGKYLVPLVHALTRLATALELSLKNKPGTDSPAMAHTALREIVERAVDEARKLPSLGGSGEPGRPPEGSTEHSYEDLLATAILNKVIEKFQKEQVDGNSNVLHGKPVAAGNCASNENEPGLDEGVEGCSSLEPLSHDDYSSDCSAACLRRKSQMEPTVSLMIEERIEEVTTTYASDEEPKENDALAIRNAHRVPFPELGMDIIDPSQESSEDSQDEPGTPTTHIGLVSPVESWEENWLFQKKRVQTQADPVAMLVPNPSADFKALIGDKDAEDTSDLSECSSAQSDEEIEKELMEAINNVVPRSPKRTSFENGDRESSNENSKEKHAEDVPEDTNRKNELETEWNEEVRNEINGNEAKDEKNEETRSKNIDDTRKERLMSNEEFKKDKSTKLIEDIKINPAEIKIVDPSVNSQEENSLGVPKTPTSTPTRTFVPENNFENVREEEIVLREDVLNSLECAKKKLMAVNDDAVEPFKEETSGQQKADFHEDIQQESEYTEHYDTATQRHLDSLTKLEGSELKNSSEENAESRCREAAALAKADSASHASLKTKKSEEEVRLAAPPRPGTIAEREHKKWENAPPIQNNPYSEENIQKRLLERQYSRRSSDIPGIHTELPKSNGEDLDVVLTPHEPDIKRFGRDYYINHSRASSNEKGRRSAASTSSRPSSSLSQGSSSTGPDQDQQVSLQLEKFEEASLRGSLSRRTYRDPYSSPHFAINPLLRMEFDANESSDKAYSVSDKEPYLNDSRIAENSIVEDEFNYQPIENISFVLNESVKTVFNPLCETKTSQDQDSGTYSIDSSNRESKKQTPEDYGRLWIDDLFSKDDQIVSSNGRRYWNFNGYKYHTFGGIKNGFTKYTEDSDEEQSPNEKSPDVANFADFKFQTFGGIKRNGKIDGKGLPTYKKVTLRSSPRGYRKFRSPRSSRSEPIAENGTDVLDEDFEEDDWLSDSDEDDTIARKIPKRFNVENKRRTEKSKRRWKTTSCRSSSDEDWQDVDYAPDKVIMTKFLKDASRKVKRSNVEENTYFLNTSRRKVFDENSSRCKSKRFSDDDSLKLEPPIVPQVVERTFQTLRDLRVGRKKKGKSPEPKKKMGVRCLSDLTIW